MSYNQNPTPDHEAELEARYQAAKEFNDKHGYYYSVLSDEEKIQYRLALSAEGCDQEIALVKSRMRSMIGLDLFTPAMLIRFTNLIVTLQKLHRALSKEDNTTETGQAGDPLFGGFVFPPELSRARFSPAPATP